MRAPPNCARCADTGLVAIRCATGTYVGPGPVPDDARGIAEAFCSCDIGQAELRAALTSECEP